MPIQNLQQFIEILEEKYQLHRVVAPVSPDLEMTEVIDRVCKGNGPANRAVLFESPTGYQIPVLMNIFGSAERMAMALGVGSLDELNTRLARLIDPHLPGGIGETGRRAAAVFKALSSAGVRPKRVKNAPAQEVIEKKNPSLDFLPATRSWPSDGGRFLTLPQVITHDPQTGSRNVGMYRMQVVDDRTLLVHWQRHKGGAEHERKSLLQGQTEIPAAVVLGGSPACIWCASAPLPPDIDEYLLAGYLNGAPVEFVRCLTQPLDVPAQAEIILEGTIDLSDQRPEGPFGDHTGYYTPVETFPTFHLTAVSHRRHPVFPATVVGIPPMEDYWMGKATERLFLPLIRMVLPEVTDICMPAEGVFHNLVLVSIKKRYPGHARKVMHSLWGMGLMMLARAIVVVDDWVDVQNLSLSAWQALGNVDWSQDILIVPGPVDHLDHASVRHSFGGKIGIDATAKMPEEGHPRTWPNPVKMSPEVRQRIDQIWNSLKFEE